MIKITWSILAHNDLGEVEKFIAKNSPYYALRTIQKIYDRVNVLKKFPKSGRVVPEFNDSTIRELLEGNYRIVYYIANKQTIIVLRIHHASRFLG